MQIAAHQKAKQDREEAKIREALRIKEEKEKETQRLRELQERAQDRQAELDQIRAQRHYEQAELQHVANERAKKKRHEEELQKLHVARQKQFADNDARVKDAQVRERDQFLQIVANQKRLEQVEREQMADRRAAYLTYKQQLNDQMKKNDECRQIEQHAKIIEGKKNRLLIDQERNRIEMIKAQKLCAVKAIGVDAKYTEDLMKKKISF